MKKILTFVIALAFLSCSEDNDTILSELNVSQSELHFDYIGGAKEINIYSSGIWSVDHGFPKWCTIIENRKGNGNQVVVNVDKNLSEEPRKYTISIRLGGLLKQIAIHQDGKSTERSWKSLLINTFDNVDWTINPENGHITYNFSAKELFPNYAISKNIFLGNVVVNEMYDISKLKDFPEQKMSPITIGSFINGQFYSEEITNTSFDVFNVFVEKLSTITPLQNLSFTFTNKPVSYSSSQELSLISRGNLGTDLVQTMSSLHENSNPKQDKGGLIYMFSQSLFRVIMDYPRHEFSSSLPTDSKLSYINSISYGIVSLFIAESTKDESIVHPIVQKALQAKNFSPQELLDSKDITIYSFTFDKYNSVSAVKGGVELIKKHRVSENISNDRIHPLSFSVNDLSTNSVSSITYRVSYE